jgi:hypothetical protein
LASKKKRPDHIFGSRADKDVLAALEMAKSGLRPLARRGTANKNANPKPSANPKAANPHFL